MVSGDVARLEPQGAREAAADLVLGLEGERLAGGGFTERAHRGDSASLDGANGNLWPPRLEHRSGYREKAQPADRDCNELQTGQRPRAPRAAAWRGPRAGARTARSDARPRGAGASHASCCSRTRAAVSGCSIARRWAAASG